MPQLYTNNAISLLETPISTSSTTIQVAAGDGDLYPQPVNPDDFFLITLDDSTQLHPEIIKIDQRVGDLFHVAERGFENTQVQAWPVDTVVDHRLTAYTLNRLFPIVASAPDQPPVVFATTTGSVDTFYTQPLIRSCKWLVTVMDLINNRTSMIEVFAVYRGPTTSPSFTTYGKTGDFIQYHITVTQSGDTMTINVVNDEHVDLTVTILRIQAS